jgi:hypothetical protein
MLKCGIDRSQCRCQSAGGDRSNIECLCSEFRPVMFDLPLVSLRWLPDARTKDSIMGAVEDVIGTMDATRK